MNGKKRFIKPIRHAVNKLVFRRCYGMKSEFGMFLSFIVMMVALILKIA